MFRVELRHGRLALSQWSNCIESLQQCLVSCDADSEFESFITRDKELSDRWTRLLYLVDHREVYGCLRHFRCMNRVKVLPHVLYTPDLNTVNEQSSKLSLE